MNMPEFFPAFETNSIPVVLSTSNLYAPYAGVFIKSLINHASDSKNYDIIIFERDISDENKRLLIQLKQECSNISIRFCNPYSIFETIGIDIDKFTTIIKFPLEIYCKLLIPHVLTNYSKIIFADTDTLLKCDIAELFDISLEGYCLGGVHDIMWEGCYRSNRYISSVLKMSAQDYCREFVKMSNPLQYINGGLYLFDTEQYRNTLSTGKIYELFQNKASMCADDTLINLALEGKIKFLDMAWNTLVTINVRFKHLVNNASKETQQRYRQALDNPHLLHWAAKPKPWVCPDVPYGDEWWQVAMQTPFMGHIIARMFDALETRKEYYRSRYGKDGEKVAVWDPAPKNIKRDLT